MQIKLEMVRHIKLIMVAATLTLGGCAGSLANKIQIPDCPGVYKPVEVINNSISGEALENLVDNVLEDRLCIARLKALLGDEKIKKLLNKLPKDTQQRIQTKLQKLEI